MLKIFGLRPVVEGFGTKASMPMIRISRWDRSWPFAQIDSQLIALFFEELFLDKELADLALEMGGAALLLLG